MDANFLILAVIPLSLIAILLSAFTGAGEHRRSRRRG
jgi:hypothetical protein